MTTRAEDVIRNRLRSVVIVRVPDGFGTGFYVSDSGLIVTNQHVVGNHGQVAVQRHDRTRFDATVVRTSARFDLALLVDRGDKRPAALELADPETVAAGQNAFAIGHPAGLEYTVSRGIVSAANRSVRGIYHVQTDAVSHPGSSGGPLLDDAGRVLGVSTFGLKADGLNFALSVRYVRELLGEIVLTEKRKRTTCASCGAQNSEARRSCRKCGKPVAGGAAAPEVELAAAVQAHALAAGTAIDVDSSGGSVVLIAGDARITVTMAGAAVTLEVELASGRSVITIEGDSDRAARIYQAVLGLSDLHKRLRP